MRIEAIADDGPLAGLPGLWVEQDAEGSWPTATDWTVDGQTHGYWFQVVATDGRPVYRHVPPDDSGKA